ncbi:hypothetical protein SAMN05519103_00317 [Rhizobiales bacterium GAS113]|nr:hypothetical protein SAMN05519103_00317 [Rhizobiales bacterium GAS113]
MTHAQKNELRDCWEACMDYATAIGCCGIADCREARKFWAHLEAALAA